MYNVAYVHDDKCVAEKGCRLCIMYCPEPDCIRLDTVKMKAYVVTNRCKGCELCIPACPPQVLRMGERLNVIGARLPELVAGCTGCGACLLVCPDFCFEIYQYDKPIVHEVTP